jgi:hypothetical protein
LKTANYPHNVFINCPFDEVYAPLLEAISFVVILAGLRPRLASETNDGAESRIGRIVGLIEDSKYSIHDLSRAQAASKGEHYRMNMPFELGMDFGCRQFNVEEWGDKRILILEEKKYRHQISISDLAGSDVMHHGNNHEKAMKCVRDWLNSEAGANLPGMSVILGKRTEFQEWYFERELARGSTEDDIKQYPMGELLAAMSLWRVELRLDN